MTLAIFLIVMFLVLSGLMAWLDEDGSDKPG